MFACKVALAQLAQTPEQALERLEEARWQPRYADAL